MSSILKTAKPRTSAKLSIHSMRADQIYLILQAALVFSNFLISPAIEFHLSSEEYPLPIDSFGKVYDRSVYGDPTHSYRIMLNSGIDSLVLAAYVLMITLLVVGVVNLSLRYKYICLLASLILWVLCLIHLRMLASVTVQGIPVSAVTFDAWSGILIPLANLALIVAIAHNIVEFKKFLKAQSNNDGGSYATNS